MNNSYLKDFPRGDSHEQASIAGLLPICTDHLNTLYKSLSLIGRLKELAVEVNSDIINAISDVETQGKFNAFLNLCFLDFIVVYKNALSAIHLWDDVYCLRQGYLLIYEAIKTYTEHSKSLKELAYKTSDAAQDRFINLTKKIKKFRKDYDYNKSILEIRNYTIGHIENDPVRLFERISKFDEDKAFMALKEFASILVSMLTLSDYIFVNYTKKIIAESSFRLSTLQEYSIEIDKLLDLLEMQMITVAQSGS